MCVIIDKMPEKEVPFANLLSAAKRNSDGWGVVVLDRGKLEVLKGIEDKPGISADKVAKVLENAKDQRVLAHFRLRTIGDVDAANTHPFQILNKDAHGLDAYLMHNGTLSGFGTWNDKESDTARFVRTIVTPLADLVAGQNGPQAVLKDPLFMSILTKYAEGTSKFALVDSNGEVLHINKLSGSTYDWGWASNTYSFNTAVYPKDWEDAGRQAPQSKISVVKNPTTYNNSAPFLTTEDEEIMGAAAKAKDIIQTTDRPTDNIRDYNPYNRTPLYDLLELEGVDDLFALDEFDYRKILESNTDLGVMLCIELAYECYNAKATANARK